MARTFITLLGALLIAACVAPGRHERDKHDRVALTSLSKPLRARLTPADTNHNGLLGTRELGHHYMRVARERFRALDKNRDGRLDPAEMPAHMRADLAHVDQPITLEQFVTMRNHRLIRRLHVADHNGDGALTRDEVGPLRWVRVRAADFDHDGRVTFEELHRAFGKRPGPEAAHQ
jgi:hypothetical protein